LKPVSRIREQAGVNRFSCAGNRLLRYGFACLGALLALSLLEAGLRLFWRQELASWRRNMDMTVPLDPEITRGVSGPARIVTNSKGIRGSEWAERRPGEYRILVIGGSNAACILQNQPNTWPALLEARLPATPDGRRVWVGNAGHGGHNSRHHVLAMRYMLDQVHPDAVVVLIGGNEKLLTEGPAYDPRFIDDDAKMHDLERDFYESAVPFHEKPGGFRGAYLWTFLTQAKDRLRKKYARGMVADVEGTRRGLDARRHAWLVIDELPDLRPGLDGYGRNIKEMIRLAGDHRVHLVFMTTPSLLKPGMSAEEKGRLWAGRFGPAGAAYLNAYWSPRVYATVLNAHDRLLKGICREARVDCIDLASELPRTLDIFWDQAHFTDYGSSRVADVLVDYFTAYLRKTQKQCDSATAGRPAGPTGARMRLLER
jgi:hypothetical protein